MLILPKNIKKYTLYNIINPYILYEITYYQLLIEYDLLSINSSIYFKNKLESLYRKNIHNILSNGYHLYVNA